MVITTKHTRHAGETDDGGSYYLFECSNTMRSTRTIFLQNNSLLSYAYIELDFLLHFIERENRIVFM